MRIRKRRSVRGEAESVFALKGRTLVWRGHLLVTTDQKNFYYKYTRELLKDGADGESQKPGRKRFRAIISEAGSLFVDFAVFHHELHILQHADVVRADRQRRQ